MSSWSVPVVELKQGQFGPPSLPLFAHLKSFPLPPPLHNHHSTTHPSHFRLSMQVVFINFHPLPHTVITSAWSASYPFMFYRLNWILKEKSRMDEMIVSDGIPVSMQFLHEENKIAHEKYIQWWKCQFPTTWTKGLPLQTWTPCLANSLWAKAPSDWSTLIYSTLADSDWYLSERYRVNDTKKVKGKKRNFLPLPSQLQQNSHPVIGL